MRVLPVAAACVVVVACLLALQATTVAAHFSLGLSDDYYTERREVTPRLHRGPLTGIADSASRFHDRVHQRLIDRVNSRRPLRENDQPLT
uniref:Secreted protein n=1 Tax=Oryza brachyantha TaxID=4533 RepID=J3LIT6_ORYBR